jgi:plasmid stability protein
MEAEHREILRASLGPDGNRVAIKGLLASMPDVGNDEDFAPSRDLLRDVG